VIIRVEPYLTSFARGYPVARDEKTQEDFAAEMGFCPVHTWNLASFASLQDLLRDIQNC